MDRGRTPAFLFVGTGSARMWSRRSYGGRSMTVRAAKAMSLNSADLNLLLDLLSEPTAPFRELHVAHFVSQFLAREEIPHFTDRHGNIVVGVDDQAEYKRLLAVRNGEPVRLFIAHMDHPGFHGLRWSGDALAVKWHGGSPVRHLKGAKVWVADETGVVAWGRLAETKLASHGRALDSATVQFPRLQLPGRRPRAASLFGGFAFRAPVWRAGQRLYTKAADDLIGVFAIMQTARALRMGRQRGAPPFLGLLTRAEEVGFIGAIGHLELGWWRNARRPLLAVSLEASRMLPGAVVGGGPIVRLGDRRTVFHADGLQGLTMAAQKVLGRRFQRRIMDGGACEATATTAYGIPTIALSVPLGNYHNQGFEGGPDCRAPHGPAPEFVHVGDVAGLLTLCMAIMAPGFSGADPWRKTRSQLKQNFRDYAPLLC